MARAARSYGDSGPIPAMVGGISASVPVAGFYRARLVSGGHPVGVRIWHGPPHDPITGEELDRSWRWQATMNGEPIDLFRVWPRCAGEPIDQVEHDYLASVHKWAVEHQPDSPQANPTRKIDLLTAPIPF